MSQKFWKDEVGVETGVADFETVVHGVRVAGFERSSRHVEFSRPTPHPFYQYLPFEECAQ